LVQKQFRVAEFDGCHGFLQELVVAYLYYPCSVRHSNRLSLIGWGGVLCVAGMSGGPPSEKIDVKVGATIRTTVISPGAIDSELKMGSGDKASRDFVLDFYKQAIPASAIARAIAYAIEQPADVDVNEIVIRPTVQDF